MKATAAQSRKHAADAKKPLLKKETIKEPSREELLQAAAELAILLKTVREENEARKNSPTLSPNLRGASGPAGTFRERRVK
jgi:hypothetical protein